MEEGSLPPHLSVLALLTVLAIGSAVAPPGALTSYTFVSPALHIVLPARLNEVSGITSLSDTELACVQDEEGVVFVYDLALRRITRQVPFGPPGDYEGIARAGSRLFVLRSDGLVFEIQGVSGTPAVRLHRLRLPAADNEGLCYDELHDRLLIAPKSGLDKGKPLRDSWAVFGFDLKAGIFEQKPTLLVGVDAIRACVAQQARDGRPRQATKGGGSQPPPRFQPSAIAVHPLTSEIFVVSAVDRVLVTFDGAGSVTGCVTLDPKLFRQPEGLAFLSNGDMVITNEAAGRQPTLLVFKPSGTRGRGGSDN